jgi:hypothetical protein
MHKCAPPKSWLRRAVPVAALRERIRLEALRREQEQGSHRTLAPPVSTEDPFDFLASLAAAAVARTSPHTQRSCSGRSTRRRSSANCVRRRRQRQRPAAGVRLLARRGDGRTPRSIERARVVLPRHEQPHGLRPVALRPHTGPHTKRHEPFYAAKCFLSPMYCPESSRGLRATQEAAESRGHEPRRPVRRCSARPPEGIFRPDRTRRRATAAHGGPRA